MTTLRTVSVLLFNEVEVLDFAGPFEVFSIAENDTNSKNFRIITIAEQQAPIYARNGLTVISDNSFDNHTDTDVLVVPIAITSKIRFCPRERASMVLFMAWS